MAFSALDLCLTVLEIERLNVCSSERFHAHSNAPYNRFWIIRPGRFTNQLRERLQFRFGDMYREFRNETDQHCCKMIMKPDLHWNVFEWLLRGFELKGESRLDFFDLRPYHIVVADDLKDQVLKTFEELPSKSRVTCKFPVKHVLWIPVGDAFGDAYKSCVIGVSGDASNMITNLRYNCVCISEPEMQNEACCLL